MKHKTRKLLDPKSIPLVLVMVTAILALANPAEAAFGASDLVFVPVVANGDWDSDVTITNVDTTPVDVIMAYLRAGYNNGYRMNTRDGWLGGRSDEGFQFINEDLADIPAGGTVVLRDLVGEYLQEGITVTKGGLVVFAYEAGTLDEPDGRIFRNIVVNSRTYTTTTILIPDPDNPEENIEKQVTYGQNIPGVPWYNMADPAAISEQGDFSYQVLTGGEDSDDYRYNLGILNTSDSQTSITLKIQPFDSDGEPFPGDSETDLAIITELNPLEFKQYYRILNLLSEEADFTDVSIRVSFIGWNTTGTNPVPAFTSYGSLVAQNSYDPTTVLPSFSAPYNVECMWPSGAVPPSRDRPLDPPAPMIQ